LSAGGGGRGEDIDREGPPLHGPGHGHQAGGHQVREQECRGRSEPEYEKSFELSDADLTEYYISESVHMRSSCNNVTLLW
jgi:hypothetical protein